MELTKLVEKAENTMLRLADGAEGKLNAPMNRREALEKAGQGLAASAMAIPSVRAVYNLLFKGNGRVYRENAAGVFGNESASYENPMPDMTLEGYIGQIPNLRPVAYHHRYYAFTDPGEQLYFNITGNSENLEPSWDITEDSANPGRWIVDVYFRTKGGVSDDTLDFTFSDVPISIEDSKNPGAPKHFKLSQNYPNPFNGVTNIEYDLPYPADVYAKVYNMAGQEVADLSPGKQLVGSHKLEWNSDGMPSGVYVLHVVVGDYGSQSIRMVLAK